MDDIYFPSEKSAAYHEALRLHEASFSVLPIAIDGTRTPDCNGKRHWKTWQIIRPDQQLLYQWMADRELGLAVICGKISGNLEVLDFDAHDEPLGSLPLEWVSLVGDDIKKKLITYNTPGGYGGWRVAWRCATISQSKQRLAFTEKGKCIIELLTNGNYALVPGGDPRAHPSGKPYFYPSFPNAPCLTDIQTITPAERDKIIWAAKCFNKAPRHEPMKAQNTSSPSFTGRWMGGETPWERFNRLATWEELLEPLGWQITGRRGEIIDWERPGKDERSVSATTNYGGLDLFHVFTSSTEFEPNKSYNKAQVFTTTRCGGDASKAYHLLEEFLSNNP